MIHKTLNRDESHLDRIIVIGDLHGCSTELFNLLDKLNYDETKDYIIGQDITDKGYDVRKLYDFFLEPNKNRILLDSNHENKHYRRAKGNKVKVGSSMKVTIDQLTDQECLAFGDSPLSIHIPEFNTVLVHAGVFPFPLNRQLTNKRKDGKHVLFIRNINTENGQIVRLGEENLCLSKPWATLWQGPENIIFGHDCSGLTIREYPFALGIDTGCVHGGDLTAVVFSDKGREIVQVRAEKQYCSPYSHLEE